jgi:methylated-DNA-[protein]-cysteine S-methyltransferase
MNAAAWINLDSLSSKKHHLLFEKPPAPMTTMSHSHTLSLHFTVLADTPLGPLRLAGDQSGLHRLEFTQSPSIAEFPAPPSGWVRCDEYFREARHQLELYFRRQLQVFELPLAPAGTSFQLRVWQQLRQVPWGATATYGEIAAGIGQPSACRAVGLANSRNPLPILIPCHRIIGSNRSLTGYNGGLDRKQRLLELEHR